MADKIISYYQPKIYILQVQIILGKREKNPSWWLWLFYRDDKLWCHLLQESLCTMISVIPVGHKRPILKKVYKRKKRSYFLNLERKQRKDKNPSHLHYILQGGKGKRATQYLLGTHNKSLTLIMLPYVLSDLISFYFSFKFYNRGNCSHCNFSEPCRFWISELKMEFKLVVNSLFTKATYKWTSGRVRHNWAHSTRGS